MTIVSLGNREYAVGSDSSDSEADAAVKDYIQNSVWSFRPEFIAGHSIIDDVDIIKIIQSKYEESNDSILKLIKDFDSFVDDAVSSDGRGHFLSSYDGCEVTLDNLDEDDTQKIAELLDIDDEDWSETYVYRIN